MYYESDDFTAPWDASKTALLLHGNFESSLAWYRWVPALARDLRVVRPDMRGFGNSSRMPSTFPWSLDLVIDDFCALMDSLHVQRFHLVGAKIGGTIARAFAARRPERVITLTVVGSPPPQRTDPGVLAQRLQALKTGGNAAMREWIRASMGSRLGSKFPVAAAEWWTDYMCRTSVDSEIGFFTAVNTADITNDIPKIACPTLVITTEGSGLATVAETRAWQGAIANSRLVVIPGDSFHAAVTDAGRCAEITRDFIVEHRDGAAHLRRPTK
jgi:pimeloyl-ACP methyl ester carboxylesterase